jgi:hypothetical protein
MWQEQARHCAGFVSGDASAAAVAPETAGLDLNGVTHFSAYDAYTLDPPRFLPWLQRQLEADGVTFVTLAQPLVSLEEAADHAQALHGTEPCAAVVNCAGLAGAALAGEPADAMRPVRGDIVLVQAATFAVEGRHAAAAAFKAAADGSHDKASPHPRRQPPRACADRAINDEQNPKGLAYVIPRRGDMFVVGGTSRAATALDADTAEAEEALRDRLVKVGGVRGQARM